jgi:hypothetical protein
MPSDRYRAHESGFSGYIAKPLDVGTFAEEVSSFLITV